MARPTKIGLDYFQLDCNLETCIRLVQAKHGLVGFAVIIKLYQKIYGELGYYCLWNEDEKNMFILDNFINGKELDGIVSTCIDKGIFSREKFEQYGILTSAGIQKRFFAATDKRKSRAIKDEYLLFSRERLGVNSEKTRVNSEKTLVNSEKTRVNSEKTRVNSEFSTQSRVEESRVEKSSISKDILSDKSDYEEVTEIWNTLDGFGDIKPIRAINPGTKRRDSTRARLKEYGVDGFRDAVEHIKESDFLQGKHNGRPWVITFDWFVKPNNFPKVLEGNYSDKKQDEVERWLASKK